MAEPVRVLFVCLGNICRSPLAEALAAKEATRLGLTNQFVFGSAGTGDWNLGRPPDPGVMQLAQRHGLAMAHHRARQISVDEIPGWDWFVVMDERNRKELLALGVQAGKIVSMGRFAAADTDAEIPDPYGGGVAAFARVFDMLQRGITPLLEFLRACRPDANCSLAPP